MLGWCNVLDMCFDNSSDCIPDKHASNVCLCLACAGVDLQKDVLDLMGFRPLMPRVKDMDHRCFNK